MMKKIGVLFILLIAPIFAIWKAEHMYRIFFAKNVPVYDGVLKENVNIRTYLRFENDFSLKSRFNRAYYQFVSPTGGGYEAIITFVCPSCLITKADIWVRSYLALLIFGLVFYCYAPVLLPSSARLAYVVLINQLPLLYFPKLGMVNFITEIPSALFLLSSFFLVLKYLNAKKEPFLFGSILLAGVAIAFRLNFFVYYLLLMAPFIPLILKHWLTRFNFRIIPSIALFVLICGYFFSKIKGFLSYYANPIKYESGYFMVSIKQFLIDSFDRFEIIDSGLYLLIFGVVFLTITDKYTKNHSVNFNFIVPYLVFSAVVICLDVILDVHIKTSILTVLLILISLLFGFYFFVLKKKPFNTLSILLYPSVFFILYLIVVLNAISAAHLFLIIKLTLTLGLISMALFLRLFFKISLTDARRKSMVLTGFVLVFLLFQLRFFQDKKVFDQTEPELALSYVFSDFLIGKLNPNKAEEFSYMVFYKGQEERVIDTRIYHKTGLYLNSNRFFYLNDWYYHYNYPELNFEDIAADYIESITDNPPRFLAIGPSLKTLYKTYELANKVHKEVFAFVDTSSIYNKCYTYYSDLEGEVYFYERIDGIQH
jgi:hypothetical protein